MARTIVPTAFGNKASHAHSAYTLVELSRGDYTCAAAGWLPTHAAFGLPACARQDLYLACPQTIHPNHSFYMDATTFPETLKAVRVGFARALPIMLGYAPVAFAFGVLATQSGMPIWLATATSILMFAGSGQFITISLWFAGAGLISTALAVFVTNLRYFLMAVALAPHVRPLKGLARLIYGWQITDELFAVHITAFQQGWELNKTAIFTATGCAQFAWVMGTVVGALCGSMVSDVRPLGLDYALCGMFIALLIPQCTDRLHIIAAILAALFSIMLRLAGLGQWNVVLGTIIAATICAIVETKMSQKGKFGDSDPGKEVQA